MKKAIRKILILILALAVIARFGNFRQERSRPVYAVGDLVITHGGNPLGPPIFTVTNMLPGDEESQDVVVTNSGTVPRFVAVRGVRTGPPDELDPKFETVLEIVISEGGTDLYGGTLGTKTVQDFFDDSTDPNGILLSIVNPSDTTTYHFEVTFPESGDNDFDNQFQGKSVIFDLIFGVITGESLVINEVYYEVDGNHGVDSPKDRGIVSINGRNITVIIEGNGAGSTNTVTMTISQYCNITQSNNATIINGVIVTSNTGGNSASGNTGGNTSIITGAANAVVNIINIANLNIGTCNGKKLGLNDEWIEIYNPTDHAISLKNWRLRDNSGSDTVINANKSVPAFGFALISKDARPWSFWNENPLAKKIELGRQIGDGLDNDGDHVYLKKPDGTVVDAVGWGDDTAVWNPAVPLVALGSSIERLVPGFDFDLASDWEERTPPTPGN